MIIGRSESNSCLTKLDERNIETYPEENKLNIDESFQQNIKLEVGIYVYIKNKMLILMVSGGGILSNGAHIFLNIPEGINVKKNICFLHYSVSAKNTLSSSTIKF
jgi:hypothetical protein